MDEREGKKRGLISSMLDLFGEEPPDSPRPGYGFTPGAEAPEAEAPAAEALTTEAEEPEAPEETSEPAAADGGFEPVTPEQIGTIRPSYLAAVPDVSEEADTPEDDEQEEAAETTAAPAAASTGPAPSGDLGPLRAALAGVLTSPAAGPSPEAAAYLAQASTAAQALEETLDPAAAAEVAAIAAEVARTSSGAGYPPPAPVMAPQPHVDPASITARVNEMLSSTERLTRDLTAQAEAEAEEIVARARRQAEQQVAEAHDDATQIVARARSEAAGIATAAERAAEDTRRTAEEEAEHIRGYARRNASMLVQAAQANRTQVQKSLEQVMDESELLSKEFVRALGEMIAGMRPVIEPVESGAAASGDSESTAIA